MYLSVDNLNASYELCKFYKHNKNEIELVHFYELLKNTNHNINLHDQPFDNTKEQITNKIITHIDRFNKNDTFGILKLQPFCFEK